MNFEIDETVVQGSANLGEWNGFACPAFTREQAEKALTHSEARGYRWHYDEVVDAFVVNHEDDPTDWEPQVFEGFDHDDMRLYAIGAYSWTWNEA